MNDSFEEEMLKIDVEAIAREFGEHPILRFRRGPRSKGMGTAEDHLHVPTKNEASKCKKTGKVQFETAPIAQEALRRWKMRDPEVCWNLKRLRIYKCKKCHKFHLGKEW